MKTRLQGREAAPFTFLKVCAIMFLEIMYLPYYLFLSKEAQHRLEEVILIKDVATMVYCTNKYSGHYIHTPEIPVGIGPFGRRLNRN